jgi:predicted nucleotidyltransferase
MATLVDFQRLVREHWSELETEYRVARLGFFGSYARGEQTASSDVDVLVEFARPVGFQFIHLADRLEELFGCKVDLVTLDALRANRRQRILADLIDA